MNYTFQKQALKDVAQVLDGVETHSGVRASSELELRLWRCFAMLGDRPGLGHRRQDLTERELFFYLERPYHIIYKKQTTHIVIHAVLHASRDIQTILERREGRG